MNKNHYDIIIIGWTTENRFRIANDVNEFVDIISISNLPSLMPKESSDYFSEKCVELLLNFKI
jgi:NAD/NADP transhydrogenase alpha subunit